MQNQLAVDYGKFQLYFGVLSGRHIIICAHHIQTDISLAKCAHIKLSQSPDQIHLQSFQYKVFTLPTSALSLMDVVNRSIQPVKIAFAIPIDQGLPYW